MEYIYDIVLNFHKYYYEYYEWKTTDKIIAIKKIPIYKVSNQTYLDLKNKNVTLKKETLPKNTKMFLITSGIEVMGILLDKNNQISKKSSLIYEEADDILEDKDLFKNLNIKYTINNTQTSNYLSRISQEKNNYIKEYLNNIDPYRDEYILKYIYYDIYNQEEPDQNKIYQELLSLAKSNINKLYTGIKKVNLELKNNL